MTSLRVRLALGAAFIAIVPLALGLYALSRRVDHTLRAQAEQRLDETLRSLGGRLGSDGARIAAQLEILGGDPLLRRLVLLRPATDRDLADYLAERRFLLGLDYLSVIEASGALIGDAGDPERPGSEAWRELAVHRGSTDSVAIEPLGAELAMVLAAGAPVVYQGTRAASIVGGRRIDAAALASLRQTSGIELSVVDAAGGSKVTTYVGGSAPAVAADGAAHHVDHAGRAYLCRGMTLATGPAATRIVGCVSTAASDQASAALRWASIVLATGGLLVALGLGLLWSWRVARPVERLAADSGRLARGDWDTPVALHGVRELESLAAALDRMRLDLVGYRERLRVSERHAAWSQMARTVAHEVKNPLTPIAIAVADLKRTYDLGRPEFPQVLEQAVRTVGEEIESLKRLLDEFSEFARLPAPSFERCRVGELLVGLETLYAPDVEAGRLSIAPADRDVVTEADPDQLRRALVNLIKNGLEAVEAGGRVTVAAAADTASIEIVVADTGPGLDPEQRANLFVPGYTTKAGGSGIGLTIVERIVSDHHGTIAVDSAPGRGTTFRLRLPLAGNGRAHGGGS